MEHIVLLVFENEARRGAPRMISTKTDQFLSHKQDTHFNVSEWRLCWELQECPLALKIHTNTCHTTVRRLVRTHAPYTSWKLRCEVISAMYREFRLQRKVKNTIFWTTLF